MKRLIVSLFVLALLISTTTMAETGARRYEKLFTDYTWRQVDYSYTYHNNSSSIYPNFRYLYTIHLPSDSIIITEDEVGNTYITYTGSSSGVYCVGELSISVDEKTIVIDCISGELHGVFIYKR